MHRGIQIVSLIIISIFFISPVFASSLKIESLTKIRNSKGYIFKINYKTEDEWTDGLLFKLVCSFSKGVKLSFTSSGLNNIKRGWHKTEMRIQRVYRERYGYITDYRIEMYHKGMLVSIRSL